MKRFEVTIKDKDCTGIGEWDIDNHENNDRFWRDVIDWASRCGSKNFSKDNFIVIDLGYKKNIRGNILL